MNERIRIAVLGVTGSIGSQACDVIRRYPERFELVGMTASRSSKIIELRKEFPLAMSATQYSVDPDIPSGMDAVTAVAESGADIVVIAIPGMDAVLPALAAIEAGSDIALASKEVLVVGGRHVMERAAAAGVTIYPVDSEHSAIWQCLRGENRADVVRIILTASGGAFRDYPVSRLESVTVADALQHPTWNMGVKVTVDSASMMNKALEMIEAHHLFDMEMDAIDVVVHRQSIDHSMVQFVDGGYLAALSVPDMRLPIALALNRGRRLPGVISPIVWEEVPLLQFEPIDTRRYPAIDLARFAGADPTGGRACTLNAANEVAVEEFCRGALRFVDIVPLVAHVIEKLDGNSPSDIEDLVKLDLEARNVAHTLATSMYGVG